MSQPPPKPKAKIIATIMVLPLSSREGVCQGVSDSLERLFQF